MFSDFRKWLDKIPVNASFYAEMLGYLIIIVLGIFLIWSF